MAAVWQCSRAVREGWGANGGLICEPLAFWGAGTKAGACGKRIASQTDRGVRAPILGNTVAIQHEKQGMQLAA